MTDRYQKQWEQLGSSDPYWAVLTDPEKKGRKWQQEAFFLTGVKEIANILNQLDELGLQPEFGTALDFGCGVGRLSQALASHFKQVLAVDISSSMLAEAQAANHDHDNIRFIHNTAQDLSIIDDESLNFIYSNLVLQHMPTSHQQRYILEFCRTLRPGGIAIFQTPSNFAKNHWRKFFKNPLGNNILNIFRSFKYGKDSIMEMHPLPKPIVESLLQKEGLEIVAIKQFDNPTALFEDYRYFARKPE